MLAIQAEEGEGSGHPSEPQPPPLFLLNLPNEEPYPYLLANVPDEAVYEEWDDRVERATTTAASLDAEQASGGSPMFQKSMGGSSAQIVEILEADLKQTKQVYGAAYTKLIMKVKKLEKTVKTSHSRRRAKIGADQPEDHLGVLSAAKVLADDAALINGYTYTRRRRTVSTGSGGISTCGASMPVSTVGMVQELETRRLGLACSVRLSQRKLDEEGTIKDGAKVQKRSIFYGDILGKTLDQDLINQRKKYFAAQKAEAKRNKPMTQAQQRNYMINYIKHMGSHTLQQLKRYSFDELKELFETTMKNVNTFIPMETKDRGRASELAAGSSQATIIDSAEVGSSKRAAEAELNHEGSKRQKTNEERQDQFIRTTRREGKRIVTRDSQQMMMDSSSG
ncbi:hypothetical protein Tco_0236919 [Tanacetum coccineum]